VNDSQTPNHVQRTITYDDATKTELIQFAAENLGMKFHPNTGIAKVSAAIRQVWLNDFIILFGPADKAAAVEDVETGEDEEGSATVGASIRSLGRGSSKTDPVVRMIVNLSEKPGGHRPVFVSVNNVGMLIPRGKEVDVPYRYYLALKEAVGTVYIQDDDEDYTLRSRNVQSYAFQVVRFPTPEEMEPWNQREWESQFPAGKAPDRAGAIAA
tara:strand:+ start:511 stop:1146 length:636 start_codon:yes stop_codon:yes gene_type:complete